MQDTNQLKNALKKYNKSNYYVQSWSEYDDELTKLSNKIVAYVKEKNIIVDAVVPILRGGNIPATFLAYKLNILTILPVQYKYFFTKDTCELRKIHGINTDLVLNEKPVFLLIEGNHCYGNQAKYGARDLKQLFPECRIIYGASNMDYKHQNVVKDAEISLYGNLTNCCKELTDEECQKLNIQYKKEILFPWEKIEEEWEIIKLKQYKYHNVEKIVNRSPLVATFDLS